MNISEKMILIHISKIFLRNGFLGTNLEIMETSDLMGININIFISLNQIAPEFEINHQHKYKNVIELNRKLKDMFF